MPREGDDGEVSCSGTCVGESPSDRLGGDHSTGPRQRTGIVAEGGINRDGGLEVPGCWIAVMRRQGGRSNPHRPLTSDDVYPQ